MRTILLDFHKFKDKYQVHKYLKERLQLPDFYGMNLDALYDMLTTMHEDTCITVIRSGQDFERGFIGMMKDAAEENRYFFIQEDGIVSELEKIMAIDSPSAYYEKIQPYLLNWFHEKGFEAKGLRKGGVLATLGGEGDPLIIMSHADTLGAVVGEIKANGHLKMSNVTLNEKNIETNICRVITEDGRVYDGTVQLTNPSVHVNPEYRKTERNFDTLEVVLDEEVFTKEDTLALGIQPGDVVAVDPRFIATPAGYIKSRYLDDKASVACVMAIAKDIAAGKLTLKRKVYFLITMYEEYGQGGACGIPDDVTDILCVDMGCVGEGLNCTEHQVSICRKDRRNVYNREMVHELIEAAKAVGVNYALDVYPFYSSDANVAMDAGYDLRHALIGPGVYASHGYERTHIDGLHATKQLIEAYIGA